MDLKRWRLLGPSGLIMNQHFGPTFHGYPRKILAMHNLQEPLQEKQKVVQWFFLCPITDRFFGQKLSNWAIELELAPTSIFSAIISLCWFLSTKATWRQENEGQCIN